jgi:hypothetical protein
MSTRDSFFVQSPTADRIIGSCGSLLSLVSYDRPVFIGFVLREAGPAGRLELEHERGLKPATTCMAEPFPKPVVAGLQPAFVPTSSSVNLPRRVRIFHGFLIFLATAEWGLRCGL